MALSCSYNGIILVSKTNDGGSIPSESVKVNLVTLDASIQYSLNCIQICFQLLFFS